MSSMGDNNPSLTYAKEVPGAECLFMPPDLEEYKDDPWDIRISIGDAPLDEAYYFTVDDPSASSLTIRDLLEKHALNPELAIRLDVEHYPELPFLQEELIQYYTSSQKGSLQLDIYVNHSGMGPVHLHERAERRMSVCRYEDGSLDYRVLDLVFHAVVADPNTFILARRQETYRQLFLLLLLGHFQSQGDKTCATFFSHKAVREALKGVGARREHEDLEKTLGDLRRASHVEHSTPGADLKITPSGQTQIDALRQEAMSLSERFDPFAAISIAPPALGVPNGFDVRAQMMEYEGLDVERAIMLKIIHDIRGELFDDQWYEKFKDLLGFDDVRNALAFKTNFSVEVLDQLKTLGGGAQ